ncbi:hypothetical protein [Candidatus Curculioniphilus buchneri]
MKVYIKVTKDLVRRVKLTISAVIIKQEMKKLENIAKEFILTDFVEKTFL